MAELHDLAITAGNNTARFPEGMAVAGINDAARELEAMIGRHTKDTDGANVSAGTLTAYTLNPYRAVSTLEAGLLMVWRAHLACGDAPTLAVDGLAAKPLTDANDRNLTVGDIVVGQIVVSIYNASRDCWECQGIKHTDPVYTVAGLSAITPVAGGRAFASDGRKGGEGLGLGTGVACFGDGTNWCACDTGATVSA